MLIRCVAYDKAASDQAYARIKKDFEERHVGLGNSRGLMILEMGLDWKTVALNAEDSQSWKPASFSWKKSVRLFPRHCVWYNTDRASLSTILKSWGLVSLTIPLCRI